MTPAELLSKQERHRMDPGSGLTNLELQGLACPSDIKKWDQFFGGASCVEPPFELKRDTAAKRSQVSEGDLQL